MGTSSATRLSHILPPSLVTLLAAPDYVSLDDPESLPWLDSGVTTEVDPQCFRLAISGYSPYSISLGDSHGDFRVCQDVFPPRLYWRRDGLHLARELTADEASLLSVL